MHFKVHTALDTATWTVTYIQIPSILRMKYRYDGEHDSAVAGFPGTNRPHYPTRKEQKSTCFPWDHNFFPMGKAQLPLAQTSPNLPLSRPIPICHSQGHSQLATVKASPNLPLSRSVPICHSQGQSQFATVKAIPNLPLSRPVPICNHQGQSQYPTIKAQTNLMSP